MKKIIAGSDVGCSNFKEFDIFQLRLKCNRLKKKLRIIVDIVGVFFVVGMVLSWVKGIL